MKTCVRLYYRLYSLPHFFSEWENVLDKLCKENQNTRFKIFSENHNIY
jgi:hypothetical protein